MIIGLAGKKQNGKDLFSDIIVQANPSFTKLSFAAELKRICRVVFGFSDYQVSNHEGKDKHFDTPVRIDDYLTGLKNVTGLELQKLNLVAYNPRQVLQYVGTDYIRNTDEQFWLRPVLSEIELHPDNNYVITDCRFKNEVEAVKRFGGLIIQMRRLSMMTKNGDHHASERINFDVDYILDVPENNYEHLYQLAKVSNNEALFKVMLHSLDGSLA